MPENRDLQYWVARLYGPDCGDRRLACRILLSRLRDEDWRIRQAACEALGRLRDVRAVKPLIQRLGDQHSDVCQAAGQALNQLTKQGHQAELSRQTLLRAADPLIEQFGHKDLDVSQAAWRALDFIEKAVGDPTHLFCASCLARFQHEEHRQRVGKVSVPVCRLCGRAAEAVTGVGEVVAVLDTEMSQDLSCADGVARVSYLKRDAPFDFDRVRIVRAADFEVERFCIKVGNDTDPFRKERYRKMRCVVAPGCRLSENTLRILRSMFGKVDVRKGAKEQ